MVRYLQAHGSSLCHEPPGQVFQEASYLHLTYASVRLRGVQREGDTREAILRTAGRLLQSRGYNGFSYAHVADALGVRPAAIHYHFKNKRDLGVAVARSFRDRWRSFREAYVEAGPRARLDAVFDMYARLAERRLTCPAASIHAELDAVPEEVGTAAADAIRELVDWLEEALEDGRRQRELHFEGHARELALVLVALAQGALQIARSQGPEVFQATRNRVFREVFGPRGGP